MRITFVGPFGLTPKSTMRVRAVPLARALVELGHHVTIIMPPWHTQDAARTWVEDGVSYQYVAVSRIPLFGHLVTTWRLLSAALVNKPDVIHFFKPKGYSGFAALTLWLLKKLGLAVRMVLDEDDWEGAGGWNDREPYPALMKRVFAWQELWGLRHCDSLTVASRALQTIAWSQGVAPGRVCYLPNGAPRIQGDSPDMRRTLGLEARPVVLVYSRFVEFNIQRLVNAWQAIAQQLPEVRLLVIGEALESDKAQELANFYATEAGQAVVHPGWVPMNELPAYFKCADLAIFLCDDTLINRCKCSVKLTDLLTCGVPVIAEAVGQNAEYIEHNRTGWLVRLGDQEELVRQVVAALGDENGRINLASRAIDCMRLEYGWEKLALVALQTYSSSASP